ncbi:MAG: TetR family transcriptional regulator [Alphaproteobacteria bacterium]|nr:TetR family transcriptional regulator [Alphaproteobacteria bacterium]
MTARKPRPTRKRIDAGARRAQILQVAGDMFAKDGIDATSMRRIAAKAGVTAALLYKHFADKDALLTAISEGFFVTLAGYMEKAIEGVNDPVARLKAQMRAYVTCGIDNPRAYHLAFMTALPRLRRGAEMKAFRERRRRGEPIAEVEMTLGMKCFGRLEQAVADVVEAKLTRSKDVATLSEVVWAGGHGLVSLVITHDDFGFSPTGKLVDQSIELMLHGLLRP